MLDPNEYFRPLLEKNLKAHPSLHLERFVLGKAEEMSAVSDESVDAVVCTLVLCSVDRIAAVLSEVRRVLVPVSPFFYHVHLNSLSLFHLFPAGWQVHFLGARSRRAGHRATCAAVVFERVWVSFFSSFPLWSFFVCFSFRAREPAE
jgi:SAM-dependent methyltransferase